MRVSRVAKVWFGFQFLKFAKTVFEERQAYHHRMSQFHGYSWDRVRHIIGMCYSARPDIEREACSMSADDRNRFLDGLFTCDPRKFRETFGFDRPPA